MTIGGRKIWQVAVVLTALVGATAWSYDFLRGQREAAESAARELARCRQLIGQIGELSQSRGGADTRELATADLAGAIEEAARGAGVPAGSLARIAPQAPRQIGQTPFKEASTEVFLQNVTLQQLVGFLHAAASGRPGLVARSLRLSPPQEEEYGRHWTAEITLGHLIYAPQSENRR